MSEMRILTVIVTLYAATTACLSMHAGQLGLPFHETFPGKQPDPAWVKNAGTSATVRMEDGWMGFEAQEQGHASIHRPLETDMVTLSAKVGNRASVYLVWDADNWCGVGKISPTPFGRFYTTVTNGGTTTESLHRGCNAGAHHYARVQLGRDCIRTAYSNDGRQWNPLAVVARPAGLAGAPRWLACGRHYGPGQDPLEKAGPTGQTTEYGGATSGGVADIRVEKTPARALSMTGEERRATGEPPIYRAGLELLKGPKDPDFAAVAKLFPPMKWPREVVGVPWHATDIGVNYLGMLDVSPWAPATAWIEIGDPPVRFGREDAPITRRLEDGYLPVLTLATEHDGLRFEQTVFGWSDGFAVDKDLMAHVRLNVKRVRGGKGSLPTKMALVHGDGSKRVEVPMEPAGRGAVQACLRFRHPEPAGAVRIECAEFDARRAETAAHWRALAAPACRLSIPDTRISEAYKAWIVYSMLNTDTVNGYLEPHDGCGFYDSMFGGSVSQHVVAMDQFGLHDIAERVLDMQLHFQQADGLYTQDCGLPDHGALLFGLCWHHAITRDDTWLRRVAPNMTRACDWIVKQRAAAPAEGMVRGLIKFRPYNDHPQPVFNYLGNLYCCVGMEMAAKALGQIGMEKEAAAFAAEAGRYRADILASMDAAAFRQDDLTILPIEPDTRRLLKLSNYGGGDYYGLVASNLLEMDFFRHDDKQTYWLTGMLEKRRGLIAGVCDFMEGIDHAYTYGYLMTQMRRNDVPKVLLGFNSMLAHGMTRDTYSPVEVTQVGTGENHFTLPHLYSCTQQLRLLRNMMVREDGDVLRIAPCIPRAWLEPGREVAITSAPTAFGPVTCVIRPGAGGRVDIHIDPPRRTPPREIRVRLRMPTPGTVSAVGAKALIGMAWSGDEIVLKDLPGPMDVMVRFARR